MMYKLTLALEIIEQFLLVTMLGLGVLVLILLLFKKFKLALVLVLPLLAVGAYTFDDVDIRILFSKERLSQRLTVLQFNAYMNNPQQASIIDAIKQYQPDVVLLQELHVDAYKQLLDEAQGYKFNTPALRTVSGQGLVILSKIPFIQVPQKSISDRYLQHVVLDNGIHLFNVHLTSPKSPDRIEQRNQEIAGLQHYLLSEELHKKPLVMAGDFNTAPWVTPMKELKQSIKIKSTFGIKNIYSTWPSKFPLLLRAPIDLLLYSNDFKLANASTLTSYGSDHLPVLTMLDYEKLSNTQ